LQVGQHVPLDVIAKGDEARCAQDAIDRSSSGD
jgi:hypothetical protein